MRYPIHIIWIMVLICLSACIESFIPPIEGGRDHVFVITGEVTDHSGYQEVIISRTSPMDNPEYIPVNGCEVEIMDDREHIFPLNEFESGKYRVWMDQEFLNPGTSYKLQVVVPGGEVINSSYDTMPECPEVDSVYYERKEIPTRDPDQPVLGVQFYADLKGKESDSRYYRWNIEETWEYHSPFPRRFYYDGSVHEVIPPDYSKKICWATQQVKSFYTLSTKGLISNRYKMLPLHYVDNTTTKLYVGCSVLVSQYAISEPAYLFWEKLRINSVEQGGLYEKQPLPVVGNLFNITLPDHKVLGFFGASSVKTKRIFVDGIRDMGIVYDSICSPTFPDFSRMGWLEISPTEFPCDFAFFDKGIGTLDRSCVDCTLLGGTLIKPEFWPK